MTETMNLKMGNFAALSSDEMFAVDGGGAVAFVYAMGFVFSCTPLAVCVAAGACVVALGVGIYCGINGVS